MTTPMLTEAEEIATRIVKRAYTKSDDWLIATIAQEIARAHLSAGGKTPLSNIMGSLWRSAEDEVVELAKVLQTIATEPVNWNTTDHHYYAGIVGRFQLAADAALKASGPPTPSGEEQTREYARCGCCGQDIPMLTAQQAIDMGFISAGEEQKEDEDDGAGTLAVQKVEPDNSAPGASGDVQPGLAPHPMPNEDVCHPEREEEDGRPSNRVSDNSGDRADRDGYEVAPQPEQKEEKMELIGGFLWGVAATLLVLGMLGRIK